MQEKTPQISDVLDKSPDTQTMSENPSKTFKKSFALIVGASLILLILLGIGGYWVYQNNSLEKQPFEKPLNSSTAILTPTISLQPTASTTATIEPLSEPNNETGSTLSPTATDVPTIILTPQEAPADWLEYRNDDVGFSLKYPPDIGLVTNEKTPKRKAIDQTKFPILLEVCTDPKYQDADTLNIYQDKYDSCRWVIRNDWNAFSIPESRKFLRTDNIEAKSVTILGMFDVCSVMFLRTFAFEKNGFHVEITVSADPKKIKPTIENYLTRDPSNCPPDENVWGFSEGGMMTFYNDLNNDQISGLVEKWSEGYDQIIRTISIN